MIDVVLFSGKAQAGKDTSAKIMARFLSKHHSKRVFIIHFADVLKHICASYHNWDGTKTQEQRQILIDVAQKYRDIDQDFFVGFVASLIEIYKEEYDIFLIPDNRYLNEINILKSNKRINVHTVRVARFNSDNTPFDNGLSNEQKESISETQLDKYPFNFFIANRKMQELEVIVERVTEKILERGIDNKKNRMINNFMAINEAKSKSYRKEGVMTYGR